MAMVMDVTDRASVKACYDAAERQFGQVNVIVNNAGISVMAPSWEMSEEDWDAVLDTNLKGTWQVTQEGIQRLLAADAPGSIINISSSLGTQVKKTMSNYCASKAAINQFTKTLALELADKGIRANAIAPGIFKTEMTEEWFDTEDGARTIATLPCGRPGNLSELDGLLLLLASDASTYISGAVITIDAAHSIGWPDPGE
jgi:NAD(P)-dependent dehydrogenase (short-subunit alcohol dehydrogenase family)